MTALRQLFQTLANLGVTRTLDRTLLLYDLLSRGAGRARNLVEDAEHAHSRGSVIIHTHVIVFVRITAINLTNVFIDVQRRCWASEILKIKEYS